MDKSDNIATSITEATNDNLDAFEEADEWAKNRFYQVGNSLDELEHRTSEGLDADMENDYDDYL